MHLTPRPVSTAAVAALLALATALSYARVLGHPFVNYDDYVYVVNNSELWGGMTGDALVRAFTTTYGLLSNWIPLTALSLQLDHVLWGPDPFGYHLTNLVLHVASSVLLLLVFTHMTGLLWPSAFVAGAFALHPLHVESVAWVAERKDVLLGLFWMLTLAAHAFYAARPSWIRGWLVLLALGCALLAKPMAVTLPFVLLLLDVWPLSRAIDRRSLARCALEKAPLVVLAGAAGVVTLLVQSQAGAVAGAEQSIDWILRWMNAIDSYRLYLAQSVWPSGLAVFYPYRLTELTALRASTSMFLLLALTAAVAYFAPARRYLAVGWLWFLITLLPVLGFIQVGLQARADRYMYLPLIGLAMMLGFGGHDLAAGRRGLRAPLALSATAILLACSLATWAQTAYWRDHRALFERALAVTQGNFIAHQTLGDLDFEEGKLDAAQQHYRAARELRPQWRDPEIGLADVVLERGAHERAIELYRTLLSEHPDDSEVLRGLTAALIRTGRFADAKRHLELVLSADPEMLAALELRGHLLILRGKPEAAVPFLRRALEVDPSSEEAHSLFGLALVRSGRTEAAARHHGDALLKRPGWAAAQLGLARVELARGELEAAVSRYRRWMGPWPESAPYRELGGALLALGRLEEAEAHYRKGIRERPDEVDPYLGLGDIARSRGDFEAAARHYEQALQRHPGHAEAERDLGLVLSRLGRDRRAQAHLQRARKLGIRSADLEVHLGILAQRRGLDAEAEAQYRRALRLTPDHPAASNNFAWLLATSSNADVRDPAAALRVAARVVQRGAGLEEQIYDTLAAAQAANGQFDAAVASATHAAGAANRSGARALAAEIRHRLALYRAGRAYIDPPMASSSLSGS